MIIPQSKQQQVSRTPQQLKVLLNNKLNLNPSNYLDLSEQNLNDNDMENLLKLSIAEVNLGEKLKQVTELNLAENQLKNCPSFIDNSIFPNLKVLDLSHNKIGGISEEILDNFENLEQLDIGHNNLDPFDIEDIADQLTNTYVFW